MNITKKQINFIINEFNSGKSLASISRYIGHDWTIIKKTLIKNRIKIIHNRQPNQKIFKENEPKILELYKDGKSCNKIAKIFNCSTMLINNVVRKHGKSKKKGNYRSYSLNENYFNEIDTPEKAIILGFIYADGYVSEKHNYIKIQLQYRDEHILEQIKKAVNSNKPFYYRILNNKKYSSLILTSKKLVQNLVKFGCMQNKSFKIRWPRNINKEFLPDFLYGYWLGDGWSTHQYKSIRPELNKRFVGCIGIISNAEFCKDIVEYLLSIFNIKANTEIRKKNNKINIIRIQSLKMLGKLIPLILKNSDKIYIKRKIDKIKIIQNIYKEKYELVR